MAEHGDSARLLGADGPFADTLDGFAPRDAQLQMAEAIERALAGGSSLVYKQANGKFTPHRIPSMENLARGALAIFCLPFAF